MYCELPEIRRCCFCLPLRRGVLILAYANIISCVIETWLAFTYNVNASLVHQTMSEIPYELEIALLILDIVATILLVVGLHMKRELLVRIYYYFMIFSLCASVPLIIINVSLMNYNLQMIAIINYIFTLVLDLYLLLLVRSLVKKLQVSSNNTFGNQLAEFIEGSPTGADHNGTVTITIRDEIADSTKP